MKKKTVALLCAVAMTTGLVTGCGNTSDSITTNEDQQNTEASDSTNDSNTENEGGTVGNGETLVVGIQTHNLIEDYEENYLTKKIEEDLNVNLEFYLMPQDASEFKTKMSLLATGGDEIPDVIITEALDSVSVNDYGSKGIFLPLNEYLANEEISPNYYAIPEEDRTLIETTTKASDGNIYGLANFNYATWNQYCYRLFINKAWLDKLGLEVPKTTDDLYNVLTAFVNDDPNGNGKKDEIGLYGRTSGGWAQNTLFALMNSFTFYNGGDQNNGLALDESGTKVVAPFATDEWRAGLEFMSKLCEEGLLAPSMFTDDDSQFKATLNAETPIVGLVCVGSMSNWTDYDTNPNFMEMELMEPLTGPEGVQYTPANQYAPSMQYFVTYDAADPELAYRVGEYLYDYEMSISMRFGEKGVDWTDDEEVCSQYTSLAVLAGDADKVSLVYDYASDVDVWAEPNSQNWHQIGPMYSVRGGSPVSKNSTDDFSKPSDIATIAFYEMYPDKEPEYLLPTLAYTVDETENITEPITNITTYMKTSMAEFVTGQKNLDDAGWDEYLGTLDDYGLQTWLDAAQSAYDRVTQ